MTLNLVPVSVPNFAGTATPLISYNDGTNNTVAHVLLDNTGALIAPATSGNQTTMISTLETLSTSALQTTANTALAAIEASAAAGATAAAQATGNGSLATIAANSVSVPGVIPLTKGTAGTAGRSFAVNCTVAGNVSVTFSDSSVSVYPVSVGLNVFPFAITTVNNSNTTATATYENWK